MCKSATDVGKTALGVVSPVTSLLLDKKSPPNVPSPNYSNLSPEEIGIIKQQGETLKQINSILSEAVKGNTEAQNYLRQFSGLYDANGNLNKDVVASMQAKINEYQAQTDALSQQAYTNLMDSVKQTGQLDTVSNEIGLAEADRLKKALAGDYTASPGLVNQETRDFNLLKESAGQRGIKIEGDNLFNATSQSTAGNQLLADLRKNAESRRDIERNTIIDQATQANMNRLGFGLQRNNQYSTMITNPYSQSLGFVNAANQVGPQTLLPNYSTVFSGYGDLANPYKQNREYNNMLSNANISANYNRDLSKYQNSQNMLGSLLGIGGMIGGGILGAKLGGPTGAIIGAQAGQQAGQNLGRY